MATISYDIHALDDPFYRSSDGKPMADSTQQYEWIVAIKGGLGTMFEGNPDVLVVGNLLWYPVEGNNKIRTAPDAMVVFGRPSGHRGSYIQYREEGVAPHVVFEVLSPGNRSGEMRRKLAFYEQYGVEEYYILDPDHPKHRGYLRTDGRLEPIANLWKWTSPRLGVRFEMTDELRIIGPDGRRFEFYEVEAKGRRIAEEQAEANRQQAEANRQQAEANRQQAEAERRENERLRAKLRELGISPD